MNIEDDSEITATYIERWPGRTDVFKSMIGRFDGSIRNQKTWLNGELKVIRKRFPGSVG